MARRLVKSALYAPDYSTAQCTLEDRCWLLSFPCGFNRSHIIHQVDDPLPAGLSPLFPGAVPLSGGTFNIELAVELPDYLPTSQGTLEDTIVVAGEQQSRDVFLSNQMMRVCLGSAENGRDTGMFVTVPYAKLDEYIRPQPTGICSVAYPMKTLVAARYNAQGASAEDALSGSIDEIRIDFMQRLNHLLSSLREAVPEMAPHVQPFYGTEMFPYAYLLVGGAQPDEFEGELLALNIVRCVLAINLTTRADVSQRLHDLAGQRGSIPFCQQLTGEAMSFLGQGAYREVILRAAIAAEARIASFVQSRLLEEGVSRSSLRDVHRDMPFSRLLNVDLVALCPSGRKPDPNLVTAVNQVRRMRNAIVHGEPREVTQQEAARGLQAVRDLIQFVEAVAQGLGLPLERHA